VLLLPLLDRMQDSLVVDKVVDKMVSNNLQDRLVEDMELGIVVKVMVAFAGLIYWEKSNSLVFLDNQLGKQVVDRVEDTWSGQQPLSLDILLDMQEVDMAVDTLEGVVPSS